MAKKARTGYNAEYLVGLSENANQSDVLGAEVAQKHEALQQEIQAAVADPSRLQQIDIALLDSNPWQGRQSMDEDELEGLAQEIKENGFNVAMPVVARPHPENTGRFQIVFGHRRTIASQRAGLANVPTLVRECTDEDMLFLQAKENLLREQFTPIDEALMFRNMIRLGYTQVSIAEKVKKSRGYVRNRLELAQSPEDVLAMVRQSSETVRAAYYLNQIEDGELRATLIQAVLEKRITGESIPGYLVTLKERQSQERQTQGPLSVVNETVNTSGSSLSGEQHLVSPASNEKRTVSELQTTKTAESSQALSLDSDLDQDRTEQVAEQFQTQQLSTSVEQVMEAGEKRSNELLEAGKLRTMLKQLQGYQRRYEKRQMRPSLEELSLLKAIEELAHTLQKTLITHNLGGSEVMLQEEG